MFASEHTRLVNRFIGLCKNTIRWPTTLHDLGYDVELIEQPINLQSAQKIHPDIVAISQKCLHAIVADCKSGKNVDNEQEQRYLQLQPTDLKYYVGVYDKNRLKHIVCYIDNENNHDFIKQYSKLPTITFYNDKVQGSGDFGYEQLSKVLHNTISLDCMLEPTGYYPFSPEDELPVMVPHVLRGLVSFLTQKGQKTRPQIKNPSTAQEILKLIHPYDLLATRHRDQLIKKIEDVIGMLLKSHSEFNEQISKIEKGDFNTATFRSLVKICEDIVTEYESQKKITDRYS